MHDKDDHNVSLELHKIYRSYGEQRILENISFSTQKAGVFGLVGPNGSGKTTLLKIIAQLLEVDSGVLTICGYKVDRADNPIARRLVGWVPHQPLAWQNQSVETNLIQMSRICGMSKKEARKAADKQIAHWFLDSVREKNVKHLSRGWAQRYSLARAQLLNPPIMLLDEPTTGLDNKARKDLESCIEAWKKEKIILISSHEHEWLNEYSDAVISLGSGIYE